MERICRVFFMAALALEVAAPVFVRAQNDDREGDEDTGDELRFTIRMTDENPDLQRLNTTPRHQEWIEVTHGDRVVHVYVAYPEVARRVPVVVLIHENRGLDTWIRSLADQVAEEGYIVLAPDMLSGYGLDGGRTADFSGDDAAREALYRLPADQVMRDLRAVVDHARTMEAGNGRVAVAGFCWGGTQAFRLATEEERLDAVCVFYGTAPDDPQALKKIQVPVHGFYGGNDARVTSTVERTVRQMEEAGKTYRPEIYEGAGHAFMHAGAELAAHDPNRRARDAAWKRWMELLEPVY